MIASSDAGVILFLLFGTALYFTPSAVAAARQHHQLGAIAVINFFLGWSLIGWVVALAMACSAVKPPPPPDPNRPQWPPAKPLP